jgi:hypothetical protein
MGSHGPALRVLASTLLAPAILHESTTRSHAFERVTALELPELLLPAFAVAFALHVSSYQ